MHLALNLFVVGLISIINPFKTLFALIIAIVVIIFRATFVTVPDLSLVDPEINSGPVRKERSKSETFDDNLLVVIKTVLIPRFL